MRDELNALQQQWHQQWAVGEQRLESDEHWNQLEPEQRYLLRQQQQLIKGAVPVIALEDTTAILNTLNKNSIQSLRDRIAAMPGRFEQVAFGAARMMEPEVQEVSMPCRTLKSESDVDAWLLEAKTILLKKLKDGPVIV